MITGQLKNDIDKLWETFWTGGISNPLTVIEQITYLLFIKRMDDMQKAKESKANRTGKDVEDPIYNEHEQDLRWHTFKGFSPEEIFKLFKVPQAHSQKDKEFLPTVFDKMKEMGKAGSAFQDFMEGAVFMIPNARVLESAIAKLDEIDQSDQDTKGDVYEYLLSKIATAGTNGQFRTPRHIIKMMVDLMQPTTEDIVCDPSAGTMGFLVAVIDYLKEYNEDAFYDKKFKKHYSEKMFHGIEFDASMIRIGAMNLMLHGMETPDLRYNDSLSEAAGDIKDKYSLILANPPFKGSLDYDAVDPSILQTVKSKKTELLFLSMMLRSLKVGGRAAVIVPDGVLFGASKAHKAIRQEIIDNHQLQAIISMPSGVFKPYAGVSTAIMIFTKTGVGGTDNVWFYDMQADGYSLNDNRNLLGVTNESGELLQKHEENNIPDILDRYQSLEKEIKRKRTDQSFIVPVQEIMDNDYDLSINRYKEIVYEKIEYDKPELILQRINDLDIERSKLLSNLNKIMKKC
jgi:type I restriction enzyme M protein